MSTPLSRARVALRAIHRFKEGARANIEEGDEEAAADAEQASRRRGCFEDLACLCVGAMPSNTLEGIKNQ